jgi:hypothetical protein
VRKNTRRIEQARTWGSIVRELLDQPSDPRHPFVKLMKNELKPLADGVRTWRQVLASVKLGQALSGSHDAAGMVIAAETQGADSKQPVVASEGVAMPIVPQTVEEWSAKHGKTNGAAH